MEKYRDLLDEAWQLKHEIEGMSVAPGDREGLAGREARLKRLRYVRSVLLGEPQEGGEVDRLAKDIAEQKAGRLPAFMRRKLQAQGRGDGRALGREPDPERGAMPALMREKLRRQQKPRPPAR